MVECLLPKQDVASSSLVSRFFILSALSFCFSWSRTQVAKGAVCKIVITGSIPVGSFFLAILFSKIILKPSDLLTRSLYVRGFLFLNDFTYGAT